MTTLRQLLLQESTRTQGVTQTYKFRYWRDYLNLGGKFYENVEDPGNPYPDHRIRASSREEATVILVDFLAIQSGKDVNELWDTIVYDLYYNTDEVDPDPKEFIEVFDRRYYDYFLLELDTVVYLDILSVKMGDKSEKTMALLERC